MHHGIEYIQIGWRIYGCYGHAIADPTPRQNPTMFFDNLQLTQ